MIAFARLAAAILALVVAAAGCGGNGGLDTASRINEDGVTVEVSLSDDVISTADRVSVHLSVTTPLAYEVTLPGVAAAFGDFHLHDIESFEPTVDRHDHVTRREHYILEPFLPGDYVLPPLVLRYRKTANGPAHTIECEAFQIAVVSVLPPNEETPELRDIAPVAAWPERRAPWVVPAALVATTALIALAAYLRKRAKRPLSDATAPPHEIAWADLEALLAEGLHTRQEWDPFYTRLTGILRRYIDHRFGIRAPKLTSRELIARVGETKSLPASDKAILDEFLSLGDLVKFGRRTPAPEAADTSVTQCKTILRETAKPGRHR